MQKLLKNIELKNKDIKNNIIYYYAIKGVINMKNLIIIAFVLIQGLCFGQNGNTLRKELDILKPFVGKTWVCEMKDPSGKNTLHFLRQFEQMHNGKIVKFYQECKELKNQADGYYYFDPDKKSIAYIILTNNGNITIGNVKEENGKIIEYGYCIFSDRKLEFKDIYEITSNGSITDNYFRIENGEWKAGHSRVWCVK